MKINISYCKLSLYPKGTYNQWMFYYKPYTYIKGFIIRIFGVYINIREKNGTEKLIKIFQENRKKENL